MMPILFFLFVGLGIYIAFLPGASDGYKYIFKKGNSIYIGETYSTAKAAERSAESVKRFAQVSEISE